MIAPPAVLIEPGKHVLQWTHIIHDTKEPEDTQYSRCPISIQRWRRLSDNGPYSSLLFSITPFELFLLEKPQQSAYAQDEKYPGEEDLEAFTHSTIFLGNWPTQLLLTEGSHASE